MSQDRRHAAHVATRIDPEALPALDEAAAAAGLTRAAWIRVVLLAAAGVSPLELQLRAAGSGGGEVEPLTPRGAVDYRGRP